MRIWMTLVLLAVLMAAGTPEAQGRSGGVGVAPTGARAFEHYDDVIAGQGQSEVVVENALSAAIWVFIDDRNAGRVNGRSAERFVVPDGNRVIMVQSVARGGGTSREVQFFARSRRFTFRATGPNATSVSLSRESAHEITPVGSSPAVGFAPGRSGSAAVGMAAAAGSEPGPKTIKDPTEFIPAGYELYERIKGDLNKDGTDDHVLMVRNTDAANILDCGTCYQGEAVSDREECMYCRDAEMKIDRNPIGIIVVFTKDGHYELAAQNLSFFHVEPWQGGTYIPAEKPNVSIKNGNLFVEYGYRGSGQIHIGKSYNFRWQNSDFELIGYDFTEYYFGEVGYAISINFLSKRVLTRGEPGGSEQKPLKETWENFTIPKPIKLREITDIYNLRVEEVVGK